MIEYPDKETKEKRKYQKYIKLAQSEKKKYKEYQFKKMFSDGENYSRAQIAFELNMSKKVVNKLIHRIRKNGSLVPKR